MWAPDRLAAMKTPRHSNAVATRRHLEAVQAEGEVGCQPGSITAQVLHSRAQGGTGLREGGGPWGPQDSHAKGVDADVLILRLRRSGRFREGSVEFTSRGLPLPGGDRQASAAGKVEPGKVPTSQTWPFSRRSCTRVQLCCTERHSACRTGLLTSLWEQECGRRMSFDCGSGDGEAAGSE